MIRIPKAILPALLALSLPFSPAPGGQKSSVCLAPASRAANAPPIQPWNERSVFSAVYNLKTKRLNDKACTLILEALRRGGWATESEARRWSAPFERFLELPVPGDYFFATSFYLCWLNAPTEGEKRRLLALFLEHFPRLAPSTQERPWNRRNFWNRVMEWIAQDILDGNLPLEETLLARMEAVFPGYRELYNGFDAGENFAVRTFSSRVAEFRREPTAGTARFLLGRGSRNGNGVFQSATVSNVMELAALLERIERDQPVPAPAPPQRLAPPEDPILSWSRAFDRETLRETAELAPKLEPADGAGAVPLRTTLKRSRPLRVSLFFKRDPGTVRHRLATASERIGDLALLERGRRRIAVEFGYPIEAGRGRNLPPFVRLMRIFPDGRILSEYIELRWNHTAYFEDAEAGNAPVPIGRRGGVERNTGHVSIDLSLLAQTLGTRSAVLTYFYSPDDRPDSVEAAL